MDKIETNIESSNLDMRKRQFENAKIIVNAVSANLGLTKEGIQKNAKLPHDAFERVLGGLVRRGLIEVIDGEYYVTEKAKNFDEEKMKIHRKSRPRPNKTMHPRRMKHPHDIGFDGHSDKHF